MSEFETNRLVQISRAYWIEPIDGCNTKKKYCQGCAMMNVWGARHYPNSYIYLSYQPERKKQNPLEKLERVKSQFSFWLENQDDREENKNNDSR